LKSQQAEASSGSFGLTLELENRIIFKLQPNKRVLTKTDHSTPSILIHVNGLACSRAMDTNNVKKDDMTWSFEKKMT